MFDAENSEDEDIELPRYKSHTMRFLAKYCPRLIVLILKWKYGAKTEQAEKLHEIFSQSRRIDLIPAKGHGRGFKIIIDQKTALFFDQDGDKFVYDGWEAGEYEEKGKVTIFDDLKDAD
ncbi:MAG: hypothetical protein CO140_00490 [Candidatus Moranbacteria bacterium CG_4_9_14_3_um_filter_40_7]|nr:MAG: hypothetical protein COX31_01830 [Candidatus Moranbacteria bacterium CG23_combo_of_CG06-09_8_20_14_all_40_16]PIU80853.1 MAG: hypothetical protein COS71_01385 [Candidatus Moranbacteria bacterium CG06_land_8_20_14_3_00_40_12]PJA88145.1 MAG: hypothetical protein CO140_00490 [Candidatus Moranbacteria bacterium CG_4_9_14_3_um_filter_40_7]